MRAVKRSIKRIGPHGAMLPMQNCAEVCPGRIAEGIVAFVKLDVKSPALMPRAAEAVKRLEIGPGRSSNVMAARAATGLSQLLAAPGPYSKRMRGEIGLGRSASFVPVTGADRTFRLLSCR